MREIVLKRTAINSLLVMTLVSTSSYAILLPPNTAVNSNLRGVFLGIDGLYLQPSNNDLDYNIVFPLSTTPPISTQTVSPGYSGGFNLYGGVNFGQNDDATLQWMHLHSSDSAFVGNLSSVATSTPRWNENLAWLSVMGNQDYHLDDVSGVVGHTLYFNNPWSARFAGGLEYARLKSVLTVTENPVPTGLCGFQSNSEFTGVGPRVEGDLFYRLPYNFGLFANTNAALLIGRRDISINGLDAGDASYVFSNRNVVVPALGAQLGVSYTFLFGEVRSVGAVGGEGALMPTTIVTPMTAVSLAGGWQTNTYINSVENTNCINMIKKPISGPTTADAVVGGGVPIGACSTLTNNVSNYSNQGPFLGIKVTTKGF